MNNPNQPNDNYQQPQQNGYQQPASDPRGREPQQQPYAQQPYPQQPYAQQPYQQQAYQEHPADPYRDGSYQQQPYADNQGQFDNRQPAGGPYPAGPAKPARPVDTEVKTMIDENIEWLKGFFKPNYTEVVDMAKASKNQFSWAVVLLAYFLLLPICSSILKLRFGGGFLAGALEGFLVLIRGNLAAIAVFVVIAGILTLSQLIFKEYDKWYSPLNAAAVIMIPRVLFVPVSMVLRLINVGVFYELNSIIYAAVTTITIFLILKFMYHNKDKKNGIWIMSGMLALYFVLVGFSERII